MGFELVHEFAVIGTTCFVVALHMLSEQLGWFAAGHTAEVSYQKLLYLVLAYGATFFQLAVVVAYLTSVIPASALICITFGMTLAVVLAATSQAPYQRSSYLAFRAAILLAIGVVCLLYWPW